MSTVTYLTGGTLGNVNVGLSAMLPLLNPLLAQFDAVLFGSFGLGSFQADLQAQYTAALAAQAKLSIQIQDPRAALVLALQATYQIQAALAASLQLPSVQLTGQLTATLALIATLELKLGGIKALIKLALQLKIPLIKLLGMLQGALDAGPVGAWSLDGSCHDVGTDLAALMQQGVGAPPLPSPIAPTDQVWGILILTKVPAAKAGLNVLFGTPP